METKLCTRCKTIKPISEFNRRKERKLLEDRVGGWTSMCRGCLADYARWRYATKDSVRDQQREWSRKTYQNLKALVIDAYGGECACCKETEPRFLTIDHVKGNGADRRRDGEGLGGALYLYLKRHDFPKDGYQLLCYNCNCSKQQYGTCPHELARQQHCVLAA